MAASYSTKTITFSTNANKTREVSITNNFPNQNYPLNIFSATNCIVKINNNIAIPPLYLNYNEVCVVYPNNNNWEVVCYSDLPPWYQGVN